MTRNQRSDSNVTQTVMYRLSVDHRDSDTEVLTWIVTYRHDHYGLDMTSLVKYDRSNLDFNVLSQTRSW